MVARDQKDVARKFDPPTLDAPALERAALRYLERFSTSAAHLRQVLRRRIAKTPPADEDQRQALEIAIDQLIQRYLQSGLLDDATYAQGKAQSLHRSGASVRRMRDVLSAKGVAAADIDAALTDLSEDTAHDVDLHGAFAYAKRRRLGPFRATADRAGHRNRDLASLGRAGYGYEVARQIVDADDPDSLADQLNPNR